MLNNRKYNISKKYIRYSNKIYKEFTDTDKQIQKKYYEQFHLFIYIISEMREFKDMVMKGAVLKSSFFHLIYYMIIAINNRINADQKKPAKARFPETFVALKDCSIALIKYNKNYNKDKPNDNLKSLYSAFDSLIKEIKVIDIIIANTEKDSLLQLNYWLSGIKSFIGKDEFLKSLRDCYAEYIFKAYYALFLWLELIIREALSDKGYFDTSFSPSDLQNTLNNYIQELEASKNVGKNVVDEARNAKKEFKKKLDALTETIDYICFSLPIASDTTDTNKYAQYNELIKPLLKKISY